VTGASSVSKDAKGVTMPLFRWFIARRLASERLRTGLTVAGIALGIAVVLAIQMANRSALAGFGAALDATAGRTSLEIVGPGVGVSEAQFGALGWLRQWGPVSPVIEGDAQAIFGRDRSETVQVLGVDILADQPLRDYRLTGIADAGRPPAQAFLRLLTDEGAVVVPAVLARRHGLRVGDTLRLAIGYRLETFTVRALLADEGPAKVVDGAFVLMDIAAAQLAFDRLGRVDRVDVRLDDPARLDEAEREIASRLPPGLAVQRPARRGAQVEKMLAAFQFNLSALSLVALLVGMFLVYNTVATSVIARRSEIGMLRAVGTTRRTILLLFLGEAAVLAAAGCGLGIGLGWLLARAAVRLTSSTVTTLYVVHAAGTPALGAWQVVTALGLGLPLSLAAAASPALEAARVSPLEALRAGERAVARQRPRAASAAGSAACLIAALGLTRLEPIGGLPVAGFAAAILVVFGIALLAPGALYLLGRLSVPLGRLAGVEGRLAAANLAGAIPRVSVSVAALAVSLGMLVAIAVMIGSFRETVVYWVGQTLQADLFVAPGRRSSLDAQATISDDLERAVTADPAVAAVDRFRSLTVPYQDRLIVVGAGDFSVLLAHGALVFKAPVDGRDALRGAIGEDAVAVSESFARRFRARVGEAILLPTPAGARPFRVAAEYFDYSTDRGVVVMDRGTFRRHFGDLRPTSLTVYLRPGANPQAFRDRILASIGPDHRVFIHTNASLRAEVLKIFDATFAITYGLEAVAVIVALLGVTATLVTLMIERRGELALLRLVGAGPRRMRRMILIESGLLGLVGQGLGLAAGFLLALILVYVINVQSFGWTIQFHVPAGFLLQASVLLLVTTLLAGAYPARLAGAVPAGPVEAE
jgi:putative ABC transport system permease protein